MQRAGRAGPDGTPQGSVRALAPTIEGSSLWLLICIMSYPYGVVLFTCSRGMTTLERAETGSPDFLSLLPSLPLSLFPAFAPLPCRLDFYKEDLA